LPPNTTIDLGLSKPINQCHCYC